MDGLLALPLGKVVVRAAEEDEVVVLAATAEDDEDDDEMDDVPCEDIIRDKSGEVKSARSRDSRRTRKASRSSS